ncbi:MAG: alpha/beta hydrolase [Marinilabiliales bacterium]|nr:MAG: alpha/beta hydrolase [Marinilabiliales bacterium]
MCDFLEIRGKKIHYKVEGSGEIVLLLHGYLESMEIFDDFASDLAKHLSVLMIDIPGHGKSECIGTIHSMNLMADIIKEALEQLNIDQCSIIGHSMGGYIALSFLDKYPEKVNKLCLLHSTPFADDDEKKQNRNREIGLIRQEKKELIYNINIPKAYANSNLDKFESNIKLGKKIAKNTSNQGIIALLEGMKMRRDYTNLLQGNASKSMLILGKKDNYIPFDLAFERLGTMDNLHILELNESGHMGFLEEKTETLLGIINFFKQ